MEKDKALERRFQQVFVKQPNVEDTVSPSRKLYRHGLGCIQRAYRNRWRRDTVGLGFLVRCVLALAG